MTSTSLKILYHGHCFDGVMSAAIFTRFYQDRIDDGASVTYRGMGHGKGDPFGEDHDEVFDADVNAVLDFRYSPSPRLHWWCDHHVSTFLEPAHQEHFARQDDPRRRFDPDAPSCAGLLARWLSQEHGFDAAPLTDHVRWADLIDGARFESPAQAVELAEPALQLMMLLESRPDDEVIQMLLTGLVRQSIDQVHRAPVIQRALAPVIEGHQLVMDHFRRRMTTDRGVAYVDLSEDSVEGFNKFIPYHLDSAVRYTVVLTRSPVRAKVSVGSNPWSRPDPLINIAELCGRYGGGGHPVVGAVTLPPSELETARRASREMAEVLREG